VYSFTRGEDLPPHLIVKDPRMNAINKGEIELIRRAITTAQESNEYEDTESAFRIIRIVIDKAELMLDIEELRGSN
jgi:hypothetical protein